MDASKKAQTLEMIEKPRSAVRYSIVVPVGRRVDELGELIAGYAEALAAAGATHELIVVLDGRKDELRDEVSRLHLPGSALKIVQLSKEFGESAALSAGIDEAGGELIVTLPAYWQVDLTELPKLLAALQPDDDMLIAVRWPRQESFFRRMRREAFHGLFKLITRATYRDLGCGVRLMRRAVVAEIPLYGDQHRFFPALAARRGFRVREVELRQSPRDIFRGRYRVREYLHRFLDLLTVFFLVRFTKKPLRFFGSIGLIAAGLGCLFVAILVVQRMFFETALADRPALLLASLLIVLGVQTFSLGLIGELIIFTHAKDMKEYAVRRIIERSGAAVAQDRAIPARASTTASPASGVS
ncbi:MAG TPA: glycosyltransferase [Gammaproteobacteria bacterium]|nr:glycosyltransferase [Gammaproteobacteria bacterium]